MSVIRTVRGDLAPEKLGPTYGHEHLLWRPPEPYRSQDPDLGLPEVQAAIEEVGHFQRAGGRGLVEMTTTELERNPTGLLTIAERTGVHVIAATGFNKAKFSEPIVATRSVDDLTRRMIRDLEEGMGDTAIRAGVIKIATSRNRATVSERKVMKAAAAAQRETGAPLSTHTEAGTFALGQIDLLTELGVPPERILIGHLDRNLDPDLHRAVAGRGVRLGFDQVGKEKYALDEERAELFCALFEAGHGDQLLLSMDMARRSDWPSYGFGNGPGLSHILWSFLPRLRRFGLSRQELSGLLTDNPARFFAIRERSR